MPPDFLDKLYTYNWVMVLKSLLKHIAVQELKLKHIGIQ